MTTTWGDIADELRDIVARGNTVDTRIASHLARAGQHIESNYDYKYMEQWLEFTLKADASFPFVMELPRRVKHIRFVRAIGFEGIARTQIQIPLRRIDGQDIQVVDGATPTGYWLVGVDRLYFNYPTTIDVDMEALWYAFTSWPRGITDPADRQFVNYLTERHSEALLYRAAYTLLTAVRNFDLRDKIRENYDEAMTVLMSENEEREHADKFYFMNDYSLGRFRIDGKRRDRA